MGTQNISVRTEDETLLQIDALARAQDRSRNWWINQAIKKALAEEHAWIKQVERGIEAAEAGDFASDTAVMRCFRGLKTRPDENSMDQTGTRQPV